jgi:RpiR family transcriptional regulator, carbohydrate utilization regulator
MPKMNLITRIKSVYPNITVSEKRCADLILANPEEIHRLTIKELAEKVEVSLPTVVRFARRMGFKGFKDFKVALIRDVAMGYFVSHNGAPQKGGKGTIRMVFEKEMENLRETMMNLDEAAMQQAVTAIGSAERVLLFAVSSSLPIAFDFNWKLSIAGFSSFQSADVYTQALTAKNSRPTDVAVGISFSGASAEAVHCLALARANHTPTICVTSFIDSPITRHADIRLFTAPVRSSHQAIDLPSRTSQLVLLDALFYLMVQQDPNRLSRKITRGEAELQTRRI